MVMQPSLCLCLALLHPTTPALPRIRPGTVLEFEEEHGKLVVVKAAAMDNVDQLYGKLGRGRRTDDVMHELRDN
jgi:hypothetical protein